MMQRLQNSASRAVVGLLLCALLGGLGAIAQEGSPETSDRRTRMRELRRLIESARDHLQAGDASAALAAADSAASLDEVNADALYYRALAYLAQGDTTAASTGLDTAITLAPLSTRLKVLRARLLLAEGQTDRVIELLDGILAIKRNEGEALYLKGLALATRGDTLQALDNLERAIETELR